jgi:hypothetical protein
VSITTAPNQFYTADGFHPGTAAQGILADAVLDAFAADDRPRLERLRLTDQQILADAGITAPAAPKRSFFDLSPYILFQDADRHDLDG